MKLCLFTEVICLVEKIFLRDFFYMGDGHSMETNDRKIIWKYTENVWQAERNKRRENIVDRGSAEVFLTSPRFSYPI